LVELSTGLETETLQPKFTLIVCPNTSLLLLKTMHFMKLYGGYFASNEISITESHQASKTSAPGTAYSFADSLKFPHHKVKSIRDPEVQNAIGIPKEYLDKHAYHKIVIKDGTDEVTLETKVLGHNTYAQGVQKILEAVLQNTFEPRRYSVIDLIEMGWV
jgi:dihydrodipicolinate reductase